MTWYAITVKDKPVLAVRRLLRRQGIEAYVPAHARAVPGRKRRVVSALMPYIFVHAPSPNVTALWMHQVVSTRFVRGFVGAKRESGIVTISDAEISALKSHLVDVMAQTIEARRRRYIRRGGRAIIKAGPLSGRHGTVVWTNGMRAKLEANFWGARFVEIAVENLEAA